MRKKKKNFVMEGKWTEKRGSFSEMEDEDFTQRWWQTLDKPNS